MKHRKYNQQQLAEAVSTSDSIAQVLSKLGIVPAGGNYSTIKKKIKQFNLDTSHMTGMLWSKGKTIGPKRPIEDYLSNQYPISSHRLRLRLISEKILPNCCDNCKLDNWLNNSIPLELHHLDGNHDNNELSNLQLLCPNCHTLTNTYRGKNKTKTPI